jgi:hypothetical protein
MAKTHAQIEAERKQKAEERRKYLIENLKVYQRDYDEALKPYLTSMGLDPEDCDNRFDPESREKFTWSPEGRELAIKYSLNRAWDPDGEDPPSPAIFSSVRVIRCQDDRIWLNQIREDSIINLPPSKVFGRFLIAEIDLSYTRREIKADIMALVDIEIKKLKITGPHWELVRRPESRDRDSSYTYKPMEVWKMVEEKRGTFNRPEGKILSQLARELCESEGWDESYGKFEDDPDTEERVKARRKALKAAYERDKKLYYGEVIFRGISE